MTPFDLFNEPSNVPTEQSGKNTKYVKMVYTKNGTIVFSSTNDKNEKVAMDELNKYMKAV